jgi:DNA-binding NtrC family response regulator
MRPLNVLIVEDSVEDAERAVLELRRAGYAPDYRRVATGPEMSAALYERPWDLILCAHSLSEFTYEGALALVREKRIAAPVLLVSATVVDEAAVSAVKAGARDIVMKDRLSRLGHAVERELEAARNRVRQSALEEGVQRSEKRFRALIEHSFDAICLLDPQAVMLCASLPRNGSWVTEPGKWQAATRSIWCCRKTVRWPSSGWVKCWRCRDKR